MKAFDVWLQRLSHVAQFGLFVITLFTIYYTVIPLYQTAALQEGIARKEIELNTLDLKVREAHSKIRGYVVGEIVASMTFNCSGLLVPPVPPSEFGKGHVVDKMPYIFEIDSSSCLKQKFEEGVQSRGEELTKDDKHILRDRLDEVIVVLEDEKEIALKKFNEYREKAISGELVLPESQVDASLMDALNIPLSHRKDLVFEEQVRAGKSDLGWKYVDFFGKQLMSLKSIEWND